MPYNPQKHHRRSLRLPGYDYTQVGAYFVTICTKARQCLFRDIVAGEMRLNSIGCIASNYNYWLEIPDHFSNVELDIFLTLPRPRRAGILGSSRLRN